MKAKKPITLVDPDGAAQAAPPGRPSRAEAEAAVRTLIGWAGDDPDREGLRETPARVVRSYEEFFDGYGQDPVDLLARTFEETDGYDEMVVLRDIRFESHCEHHIAPILGKVHVAYLPHRRVVGISKLARVVEVYARRLQIQEKMTAQIANTINEVLRPQGAIAAHRRHRGGAPVHDHPRRPQAGRHHGHQPHAGGLPRRSLDAARIPRTHRQPDQHRRQLHLNPTDLDPIVAKGLSEAERPAPGQET